MYLKSLTLKGFKSFAQATTFSFEPGVTAIVGPNGSGKSNVLDALAWVMGEQGAKTLRGGKMEDVIFAGTASRGPLGRAEVKLTIDNSDGALPIAYTEVTISRTLFRSGASEYAINGETCRLLDVQELLSDSGLGKEMHVIVGQGQLDSVLRASPEERRGFIEEAAGILKHRRRRERTLRKLQAMETNFTRLKDLETELRRQLKPLSKQAQVAREAQTIAATLRDAKARLLADDITAVQAEIADLAGAAAERAAARGALQDKYELQQQRITSLEQQEHTEQLDAARRLVVEFEAAQSRLQGLQSQAEQRLQFLAGQDEPTVIPNRVTQADVDRVSAELQRLEALVPEAREAHAAASIAVQHKREALDAVDKEIAAAAAALNAYEMQLTKLGGEHAAAIRRQQEREAEHSRRETAASAATSRLEQAEAALKELETAEQAGGSTTAAASDLEQAYNAAGETQTRLETERDQLQTVLHRAERDQVALQATHTALAAQLGQHDGGDAVIAAGLPGVHGKVATLVDADAAHTAALGLLLGDALLVADEAAATRVLQHAAEADLGRVQVVLATAAPEIDSAATAAQLSPQIAEALVAVGAVHAESVITAAAGVKALLHTAFLAPDLAAAQQLATALASHLEHFTIATSHGEIVTPHTAVGGSATSKSLLEVRAEYDTVTAQLDTATAVVQDAKQRWEAARQAVQEAKTRAAELYQQLRQADSARAEFAAKWQRAAAQVEAAKAEQERARGAVAESENRVAEAVAAAAAAAAAVTEFEKQPRPTVEHSVRDELAAAYEEVRAAEVEQRMAVQRAQERARSAEGAYRRVREQFHAAEKAEQERAARAVQRNLQARAAQQVLDVLPQWLKQVAADLTAARQAQQEAELERAKHSQELTLLRAEAASVRQELSGLTEQAHSVELQLYERRIGLKSFTERAHNELSLDVATLLAEYGPELPVPDLAAAGVGAEAGVSAGVGASTDTGVVAGKPGSSAAAHTVDASSAAETTSDTSEMAAIAGEVDPPTKPYNRQEQEQILHAAERALAQLGRINPLALEEFAALEQRHTYLHEQIADLTKTKKDLLQIVADLDVKMETIFAAAFADTKAAFEVVFPILFPGGTGKIELTNPGDMLTTGIEITVKPAGKKVERMSLLSGGERSLAAVAWLLAIFKARPSPFYILDEVEAALDDANLGRLLNAFEDLRQHSQLIVITHQKRTMEIADALYGVSMRGDGVSAVIGQRLQELQD